jgi:hypothetical protein
MARYQPEWAYEHLDFLAAAVRILRVELVSG